LHFSIFFDSVLGGSRPHFLRFWSVPGASKFDPFLEKWCSRRGETPLREKTRFFIKNPPLRKNTEKLSQKSLKNHKMEPKCLSVSLLFWCFFAVQTGSRLIGWKRIYFWPFLDHFRRAFWSLFWPQRELCVVCGYLSLYVFVGCRLCFLVVVCGFDPTKQRGTGHVTQPLYVVVCGCALRAHCVAKARWV